MNKCAICLLKLSAPSLSPYCDECYKTVVDPYRAAAYSWEFYVRDRFGLLKLEEWKKDKMEMKPA